ncbi:MAG: DEAD/DEAH box helicase [Actinomycetaceae bacterium]|nr:DEAD/DEAH box helicase [Actinomycetaceae bacterium]
MPSLPSFATALVALTDTDIMALVGPATWGTGLTDFRGGRVLEVTTEDDGRIRGRVKGPGVTYTAWISAAPTSPSGIALSCACPLGVDCRHGVALVLKVREAAQEEAARTAAGSWRVTLEKIVGGSGAQGQPLALLIDASDPFQPISLTPLRPGRTVQWTRKRASWLDITTTQWDSVVDGLNPTHVALLREGYATSHSGSQWRPKGEVLLADLGEGAWEWLRRVERAGVTLLADDSPLTPLELDSSACDIHLDARLDNEGLHLRTIAGQGAVEHPQAHLDADTQILVLDGGLRLARTTPSAALESFPAEGIDIPLADVAEFQAQWLPKVSSCVPVVSTDHSFTSVAMGKPHVVATVTMDSPQAIHVRWWAQLEVGEQSSRTPLEAASTLAGLGEICSRIDRLGQRHAPSYLWALGPQDLHLPAWRAPEFMDAVVARVIDEDLTWEVDPLVAQIHVDDHGMKVHIDIDDEGDWFGLKARLVISGHDLPLSEVLASLSRGDEFLLHDGVWVRLDGERIDRLRVLLAQAEELGEGQGQSFRLRLAHMGMLAGLEGVADEVLAAPRWRERLRALTHDPALAALPISRQCHATLRHYQEEGHQWLTTRACLGLGGVLADDMGLGKTLQILSAVVALKEADTGETRPPILVVAPTSVVSTWASEAARFTPSLTTRVVASSGKRREEDLAAICEGADLVVTSYTLMRLDSEEWAEQAFSGLILDEAQAVKNPTTAIHRSLRELQIPWCFAVTGTPIENSLADLWSIMALACPGLFPGWKTFTAQIRRPIEGGSQRALERLHTLIAPFILRRRKEEVATDLPDRIEQVVSVDLGEEHRHIHDQYLTRERTRILGLFADFARNRMDVLASITRLRQLALDPALVDSAYSHVGSAKIEYLADQLDQLLPAGHKVLVFSQFTSFLARIRAVIERRGHKVTQLTGSTRNREAVVTAFREGPPQVFLISLKAGGTGLTLTEADYVFVMDPWWNPAAEAQAVDRAHRIGQTRPVNVYRLAARDTIEEKVLALQEKKRQLVRAAVDGGGMGGQISVADLRSLLDD